MRYIPHTPADIDRMLHVVGASSIDDLFTVIPEPLRPKRGLDLPPPLCEADLLEHLRALSAANQPQSRSSMPQLAL